MKVQFSHSHHKGSPCNAWWPWLKKRVLTFQRTSHMWHSASVAGTAHQLPAHHTGSQVLLMSNVLLPGNRSVPSSPLGPQLFSSELSEKSSENCMETIPLEFSLSPLTPFLFSSLASTLTTAEASFPLPDNQPQPGQMAALPALMAGSLPSKTSYNCSPPCNNSSSFSSPLPLPDDAPGFLFLLPSPSPPLSVPPLPDTTRLPQGSPTT